jgi:hypothetical protein
MGNQLYFEQMMEFLGKLPAKLSASGRVGMLRIMKMTTEVS